jgi:hypothetical protein
MLSEPTNYIRRALEAVSLEVDALKVEHYAPEAFGNLVAMAQTNVGELKIVYDRGFYLEAREPDRISDIQARIIEALITARDS